jgi:hypothetical protein
MRRTERKQVPRDGPYSQSELVLLSKLMKRGSLTLPELTEAGRVQLGQYDAERRFVEEMKEEVKGNDEPKGY